MWIERLETGYSNPVTRRLGNQALQATCSSKIVSYQEDTLGKCYLSLLKKCRVDLTLLSFTFFVIATKKVTKKSLACPMLLHLRLTRSSLDRRPYTHGN